MRRTQCNNPLGACSGRVDLRVTDPPLLCSAMQVKFIDLDRQLIPIRAQLDAAMQRVIDRGAFVLGDEVEQFEKRFAEYVGAAHAIGVSSGTDALLASLMAMGIGPGDEVITSAFSFIAPAQAIARLGATPVFVDIDPHTFTLDPHAVRAAIGPQTAGIVPVHLFGQAADMTAIRGLAEVHGLFIVEDAAQGVGAKHGDRHVGTFGELGCFSFFPTKTLGAFGDGGMIVTDDAELASEVRRIRHHGAEPKYVHHRLGGNFRLDALQAAVLDVKLDHLTGWIEARRDNAAYYNRNIPAQLRPGCGARNHHAWHQYTIRLRDRDAFRERLRQDGIETQIYYPTSCERQPCFADLAVRCADELAATHAACVEVLALPVYAELSGPEREHVANRLTALLADQAA